MTTGDWSYSGDPSINSKDAVRFLIGDTVQTDPLLFDEEINWLISENTNVYEAAAQAAERIADNFARLGQTKRVGDLALTFNTRSTEFRTRAKSLRLRASRASSPVPYSGGMTESDKDVDADNDDIVQPEFVRGMFSNPEGVHDNSQNIRRSL